jgi:hypothetical protein
MFGCGSTGQEPQATQDRCQLLATRAGIDEACALEIAKKAIVAREGKLDKSRFKVRFHEPDKVWVVEAIREPEIPGGFRVISVDRNGKVVDYMLGL